MRSDTIEQGDGNTRFLRGASTSAKMLRHRPTVKARRFGDELLKREEFASLLEAKVLVEEYREHYNQRRPHSALGYRTPLEFAATCHAGIAAEEGIVGEGGRRELEFVPVLSWDLVQKTGSGHPDSLAQKS